MSAAEAAIYSATYTANNSFNWVQQLAIPALQAAAQVIVMEYQASRWDDENDKKIAKLDEAVTEWNDCMDMILDDVQAATDDVPEPAMYQPVSPAGEQWDTIVRNQEMACKAKDYSGKIGRLNLEIDIARANILNPKYYQMNETTWCSIESLMNGELPIGLTIQNLTKSAGQNFSTGRLGRHIGNYRRNMGILDYQVQKAARSEQREERASQASSISSLARQGDIRDMMQTPQQRIAFALQQAQLIQNSLQNANNAAATKAPYLMQKVQIGIQKCQTTMQLLAGKASVMNSFVPDYGSVVSNAVDGMLNNSDKGYTVSTSMASSQRTPNQIYMPSPVFQSNTSIDPAK